MSAPLVALGLLLAVPLPPQGDPPPPDEPSLSLRANRAIARGVAFLRGRQQPSGDFAEHAAEHPGGAAALVGYAFVKSGVRRRDPDLLRLLEVVRATEYRSTYSHSLRLLLLAALGDPERWADEAAESLAFLLETQRGGAWAYPWGEPDLSNTQLALLGLRAAGELGLDVPDAAFAGAADAVWRFQRKGEGFAYRAGGQPTGGMTAATLGGLALLDAVAERSSAVRGELRKNKRERAAARGWMEARFDLAHNPYGPLAWTTEWHHVYLWAVERWAGFAGLDEIGGRDWYAEGARLLVDSQAADGSWGPPHRLLQNTSFALLFLRRATVSTEGELAEIYATIDRELDRRAAPVEPAPAVRRIVPWLVAGPWQGEEGNGMLLDPPFDPARARPREGGRTDGKRWRALELDPERWSDLQALSGSSGSFQMWAAATFLEVRAPTAAVLWLDAEDGTAVYLDGARVGLDQRVASRIDGLVRTELALAEGVRALLVLVEQEGGAVPFGARLTDPAGRPLAGAVTARARP